MDGVIGNTTTACLCNNPDSSVIYHFQTLDQFIIRKCQIFIRNKTVHMLFKGTDGFHQRTFEVCTDTHNLTGCFHLCSQCTFCSDKFIKRQTRDLYNAIIQHRLETCISFSCNGIFDFIQCIAKCDLCGNFCNWISGCLGSQGGRTAYTRVNLDDTVFKGIRIQRILYITSTGDVQLTDNI